MPAVRFGHRRTMLGPSPVLRASRYGSIRVPVAPQSMQGCPADRAEVVHEGAGPP